jgi:hypothetical protein
MAVPSSYLTSTKNVAPILDAIRRAAVPQRFTHQFLKQLGFTSSNDRAIVAVFKALGFLDGSGAPTARYRRYRDAGESQAVLAEALRDAYADVFALNQEAYDLPFTELRGIFARLSGKHEGVVEKMASTFKAFAGRADFSAAKDAERADTNESSGESARGSSALSDEMFVHPLIEGLLRELPPPGSAFPRAKQKDWLEIAEAAFRLMYGTEDEPTDETDAAAVSAADAGP